MDKISSSFVMEIVIVLDRIRSMYNVGSFFRTCDGAGVKNIIITGYTATPPRKEISKTALHADEVVPWEYVKDPVDAVQALKRQGYDIIAIEKNASSEDIRTFNPSPDAKLCLIFGNEVEGVTEELLQEADRTIHLPMLGVKESLNVAVSAGAVLYRLL